MSRAKIPVLLLKTKSAPEDNYYDYFSALGHGIYTPTFVPVLEHRFRDSALAEIRDLISSRAFTPSDASSADPRYGAMIFTSQRAVEAFTHAITTVRSTSSSDLSTIFTSEFPFYVVGPATARGLRALDLPCPILGEDTGNGEALAQFILAEYKTRYPQEQKPPLLFLVGEKRRDIIPSTLGAASVPVTELVVYETGEMASFRSDFTHTWRTNEADGVSTQWVVVFSPTGCRAMLESLGLVDGDVGIANPLAVKLATTGQGRGKIYIATIGPTTRDYLREQFGLEPDVCAETPTPEGVGAAIVAFMMRVCRAICWKRDDPPFG